MTFFHPIETAKITHFLSGLLAVFDDPVDSAGIGLSSAGSNQVYKVIVARGSFIFRLLL